MTFLIAAAFLAGFIDAIVGGGGLIFLPALMSTGLAPNVSLGTNKLVGISTAMAGSSKYIHSKSVRWNGMKPAIVTSFIGALIGASLASFLSNDILKHFIFYLLIFIAIFLLLNKEFGMMEKQKKWKIQYLWLISFIVGAYDGFFGPGTGTFLVIAFVHVFGYSFLAASATGRILNLTSNVAAVVLFSYLGLTDFYLIWPCMIAAFVGGLLGASYSVKYGPKGIRPVLFVVVFGLIIKLGMSLYG